MPLCKQSNIVSMWLIKIGLVVIDLSSRTEIRSIPGREIHGVALVPE